MYNNPYMARDADFVAEAKLYGYKMHDLYVFPAIVEGTSDNVIIGEIWDVHSKETMDMIHKMEIGAGFERKKESVIVEDGAEYVYNCYVYVHGFPKNLPDISGGVVENGDWREHYNNKQR